MIKLRSRTEKNLIRAGHVMLGSVVYVLFHKQFTDRPESNWIRSIVSYDRYYLYRYLICN